MSAPSKLWPGFGLVAFLCGFTAFAVPLRAEDTPAWQHGAVAADHPLASQAGVEILQKGGNVVDAAVATGFALSVLRPGSSGIGGGGFMVIWNVERGAATTLDYRERAPLAATRDLFTKPGSDGKVPSSRNGGKAVAVPGHVAGLCHALEKFGSMKLAEVLAPAIRLAEDGVPLDEQEVSARRGILRVFNRQPELKLRFPAFWEGYLLRGEVKRGVLFRSPQLPALRALAKDGVETFYRGEVAHAIAAHVQKHGGLITEEDLATMDVVERKPMLTRLDGMQVYSMPPSSSGGVALTECLNILASLEKTKLGGPIESLGHNSPEYLHVLAESLKHAFADRAEFLGDPDFTEIPVPRLTDPKYAEVLAGRIELDRTRPSEDYGRFLPVDDAGTTHFSVIDSKGNAVACTETINTTFGSWVVEPRFGIVLNNEMDDFAAQPGKPNAFGLIQSEANAVAPRHRPLSSMTPTIAVRDGKAVFALGASGGPRIISTTLQVLLNLSRFGMDPEEAVTRPRAHHQWLPDTLDLEPGLMKTAATELRNRNHVVKRVSELAVCQAVARTKNGLKAKSDPRKHGQAAGY